MTEKLRTLLLSTSIIIGTFTPALADTPPTSAQLEADQTAVAQDRDFVAAALKALDIAIKSGNATDIAAAEANLTAAHQTLSTARSTYAGDFVAAREAIQPTLTTDRAAIDAAREAVTADIAALADGSVTSTTQLSVDLKTLRQARVAWHVEFVDNLGDGVQKPAQGSTGELIDELRVQARTDDQLLHALKDAIAKSTSATVTTALKAELAVVQGDYASEKSALEIAVAAAKTEDAAQLAADQATVTGDRKALKAAEKQLAKDIASDNTAAITADQAAVASTKTALEGAVQTDETARLNDLGVKVTASVEKKAETKTETASVAASLSASASVGTGASHTTTHGGKH